MRSGGPSPTRPRREMHQCVRLQADCVVLNAQERRLTGYARAGWDSPIYPTHEVHGPQAHLIMDFGLSKNRYSHKERDRSAVAAGPSATVPQRMTLNAQSVGGGLARPPAAEGRYSFNCIRCDRRTGRAPMRQVHGPHARRMRSARRLRRNGLERSVIVSRLPSA